MKPIEQNNAPRRHFLRAVFAAFGAAALSACDRLSNSKAFVDVLQSTQYLNRGAHKLFAGRKAMAQEFTEADIAPSFRSNGTLMPVGKVYEDMVNSNFANWKLEVGGLVETHLAFSLADLRAMPSRTQITRHDCVEGWSAIAKWTGVPLHHILDQVKPLPNALYVVFRCADAMDDDEDEASPDENKEKTGAVAAAKPDSTYYESMDMDDAYHVQTILDYDLNGKPLPVSNGAPLRLRIERQLGYKHAKYLMKIELVESFDGIRGGKGGYWEDNGYEWYGGI
jgi:DMSO/TMAO reductase YedYZ molybdopterin-dependent catalytic subunit